MASYPLLNSTLPPLLNHSRYFPLRRADNDSQYVLGRTFLQEAYVIANYENQTFSVSPRSWSGQSSEQSLRAIPSLATQNAQNRNRPSSGPIAGIAVGSVAFIAILAFGLLLARRSRKKRSPQLLPPLGFEDSKGEDMSQGRSTSSSKNPFQSMELMPESDSRERHEIGQGREIMELGAESRAEMPGSKGPLWHEVQPPQRAAKRANWPLQPIEMDATQVFELPDTESPRKE